MASNDPADTNPAFASTVSNLSAGVATQADKAISATQRATDLAADKVHRGLDQLREDMPFALSRASATADALLAEGADRAREAAHVIRSRAGPMQQQAQDYIRQKPMQSVLIAAGIGALLALLLTRSSGR